MLRSTILSALALLMIVSHASASDIRRIVTGLDANNRSMAVSDSQVHLKDLQPDLSLGYLWVTDTFPVSPSKADTREKVIGISPPENGTQFGVVEFQPADPANPTPPIWHRTRTVDYVVVLSGNIDLMLDDSVVHLKSGDTVVQQATNHAWVNRGKEIWGMSAIPPLSGVKQTSDERAATALRSPVRPNAPSPAHIGLF